MFHASLAKETTVVCVNERIICKENKGKFYCV